MTPIFRHFDGPNTWVPFAAVIAEWDCDTAQRLPRAVLAERWRALDNRPLDPPQADSASLSRPELVAALACMLQHPDAHDDAVFRLLPHSDGRMRLALACVDAEATTRVLHTAIRLADRLFAESWTESPALSAELAAIRARLRSRLPQMPIIRSLVRAARLRGIPVCPPAAGSQIWQLGQGAAGRHFFEAASERDSLTGSMLSRNKMWSNNLVKRLGFPGTTHRFAGQRGEALAIARHLGFPLVVKPVANGKGRGVFADIRNESELLLACDQALAISPGGVIVEKHVPGDEHRLAVFGGKLAWAIVRHPPRVTGDGQHTIAELITQENRRRSEATGDQAYLMPIKTDDELRLHLKKQGLELTSRPAGGETVSLRTISNLSRGGTLEYCTHRLHPDVRDMAEAIARATRMDALGIDFITPDIGLSWLEAPCAVLEINQTPGISTDANARDVLAAHFPPGSEGRIPSVLLVNPTAGLADSVTGLLANTHRTGYASADTTRLDGAIRCAQGAGLAARVQALLADPGCEALVVAMTSDAILQNGLPLDRFDLICVAAQPLPAPLETLLPACCPQMLRADADETGSTAALMNALQVLAARSGGG